MHYRGNMVGSTGQPFSSIMGKVDLESFAIATQFLQIFCMHILAINKIFLPCKYAIWSIVWYLNLEGEPVSNPDGLNLLGPAVQDPDSWGWRLRSRGDADHVWISDWHHAKGDVLAASVVCASDLWYSRNRFYQFKAHFVDFVRLRHHHTVTLNNHRVCVDTALKELTLQRILKRIIPPLIECYSPALPL